MNQSSDTIAASLRTGVWESLEILNVSGWLRSLLICPRCAAMVPLMSKTDHIAWHLEGNH